MRLLLTGLLALTASTTLLADTQRPAIPQGLTATIQASDSIRLDWDDSSDNVGVAGYNIYRNGDYLSTAFDNEFEDGQVRNGNTYEYSVTAFDSARNYTRSSDPIRVSLGNRTRSTTSSGVASEDSSRPLPPDDLSGTPDGGTAVQLSWNAATGNILGYNIYRNGSYRYTVKGSTQFTDRGLRQNETYRYRLVSFTSDARYSTKSDEISVQTGSGSARDQRDESQGNAPEQASANASTDDSASESDNRSSGGVPSGYTLVFSDEFNGGSIDSSKWNSRYRWGPNWIINGEKQYYVDSQSNPDFGYQPFRFGNGALTITASRTPDNLRSSANYQRYLSGALTTYGKFRMKYGYVEMRARMPGGRGLWPAFWLLHQNENRNRPEIDVVELLGHRPRMAFQTYHWYDNARLRSTPTFEAPGPDYTAGFHTFGMKWEPGRITWYVDGQETNVYSSGSVSSEEMYLLVNLAVGGYWPGEPDSSTPFPAQYTIDYIRAYRPD